MKTNYKNIFLPALLFTVLVIAGCDKTKPYDVTIPPAVVHFTTSGALGLKSDESPKGIVTVGTSNVEDVDREFTLNVTSPTGAVAGQQYTISPATKLVIPKGQATVDITIEANPDFYNPGDRDTLILELASSGSTPVAEFMQRKVVVISGPCDDSDVDIAVMAGVFANSSDADGTYSVTVSGLTELSPTTAKGMITNLWDGIGPVEILFDWSDPSDISVTIPWQATGLNYAAGQPLAIRTSPERKSTFSVCDQKIHLVVDLIVENYPSPGSAAFYDRFYSMTVSR